MAYIKRQGETETPFFLALWHYTVHWPMDAPTDLVTKYKKKGMQRGLKDPRYAGMTEALDQIFGRVMDALEETGQASNTLVIFTSDNGPYMDVSDPRPLRAAKGYLYEGGIRVPLMVRWPGRVNPETRSSVPAITTDLFATVLEAAQVPLPDDYPGDGESLVPVPDRNRRTRSRRALLPLPELCLPSLQPPGRCDPRWRLQADRTLRRRLARTLQSQGRFGRDEEPRPHHAGARRQATCASSGLARRGRRRDADKTEQRLADRSIRSSQP